MAEAAPKQTIEEKLAKAVEFKELGNQFHKDGNYKAAAGKYHRAILYMKVHWFLVLTLNLTMFKWLGYRQ